MDNNCIISLRHVSKVFDGVTVVDDFNLDIKKGEFVTILGPSGCGKTTTLRMIAGFQNPTSGEILLNGEDISKLPPYKRPVNTVFQRYALFPYLNVYDNVAFGLKLKRIPVQTKNRKGETVTKMVKLSQKTIDEKVARALSIVDLDEMEERDVSTLSGGQQQRVAIARAIVLEPQVLLLDEPLSALDRKMRKDMQIELKEMHKKLGITFIYVTHDQEEALTMSDTIIVMKDGHIEQVGTPEDIYNEPVSAYVADFIGESNIYNGTMVGKKKVRFLGGVFNCVDDFPLNEKVDVVVRPEDVVLGNPGKGVVDGVIENKVFQGVHYSFSVAVGKAEVIARDTHDRAVGSKVSVHVAKDNIQVMHRDNLENEYRDACITGEGQVMIGEDSFPCDLTQLLKGSHVEEEGSSILVSKDGKRYDLKDAEVIARVAFDQVNMSDDLETGKAQGRIVFSVYIGDHYHYIIRTLDEEEDYEADSPYEWLNSDVVSVDIPAKAIRLQLKKPLEDYEAED